MWGYNTSAFNNELRNGRFYSYSQPTLIKDLEPEHVIGINALGFHTDTNLIMSYTDKNGGVTLIGSAWILAARYIMKESRLSPHQIFRAVIATS